MPLHLVHDVPHAHQVLAGRVELALRLVPLLLVPGDARRLLDEDPALVGLGGEDVVQLVLVHHRVGARIGAGAGEEVEDVAQARQVAVQEVLALARSIEAAAHGHLGPRHAERAVVREHELDLAEPHGLARRRAVEDQVLHPLAAERLGALLAERPADGFGDVAVVDDDVGRDEIVSLRHGEVVHPGLGRRHTLDRNDLVPVDVRLGQGPKAADDGLRSIRARAMSLDQVGDLGEPRSRGFAPPLHVGGEAGTRCSMRLDLESAGQDGFPDQGRRSRDDVEVRVRRHVEGDRSVQPLPLRAHEPDVGGQPPHLVDAVDVDRVVGPPPARARVGDKLPLRPQQGEETEPEQQRADILRQRPAGGDVLEVRHRAALRHRLVQIGVALEEAGQELADHIVGSGEDLPWHGLGGRSSLDRDAEDALQQEAERTGEDQNVDGLRLVPQRSGLDAEQIADEPCVLGDDGLVAVDEADLIDLRRSSLRDQVSEEPSEPAIDLGREPDPLASMRRRERVDRDSHQRIQACHASDDADPDGLPLLSIGQMVGFDSDAGGEAAPAASLSACVS